MLYYKMSETGLSHRAEGLPNQDRVKMVCSNDVVVLAVADGMGGEALGEQAAEIACSAAYAAACSTIVCDREAFLYTAMPAVQAGFGAAFNALQKAKLDHGWNLGDLGTTLMVAAYNVKTGDLFYGYVGDGGFAVNQAGECFMVEQPQKGDNANQTFMVLDCDHWRFGHIELVQSFYVATDGIGDCIASYNQEHGTQEVSFEGENLLSYPVGWTQSQVDARMDDIFKAPALVKPSDPVALQAYDPAKLQAGSMQLPAAPGETHAANRPYAKRYTETYAARSKARSIPIEGAEPSMPEPGPDPLPGLFDLVDDDRTVVLVWSDSVDVRNEWPFYEQAVYAKVNPAVARRICRNRKSPLTRIRNLFQSI